MTFINTTVAQFVRKSHLYFLDIATLSRLSVIASEPLQQVLIDIREREVVSLTMRLNGWMFAREGRKGLDDSGPFRLEM